MPTHVQLLKQDDERTLLAKTLDVLPSARQLAWHDKEWAIFVHYGMNTYTDREWGDGKEAADLFCPTDLDADEYVRICKQAGAKQLVLTCKHHDGFCLWPSAYTNHCVKPEMDVVKAFREACTRYAMPFGIYLSPWDRHEATYGSGEAYNAFYLAQLKELLTTYGPIEDVWLDGACGEGPNGKVQAYDWQAIIQMVRTYAPKATISSVGPDVRWCGNEAGKARTSEWNVQPIGGADGNEAELSAKTAEAFVRHNADCSTQPDLGSLPHLKQAAQEECFLYWYPAQIDVSIRPGWFYHASENDQVKSAVELYELYLSAVGSNTQLLLNVPMNQAGRMPEADKASLLGLGELLKETFATDLATEAYCQPIEHGVILNFDQEVCFDLIGLKEDVTKGQRVAAFRLESYSQDQWQTLAEGTTIGHCRFVRLVTPCHTTKLRLVVTQTRGAYVPIQIQLYTQAKTLQPPVIHRDPTGWVTLETQDEGKLFYQIDEAARQLYEKPFLLDHSARLQVSVVHPQLGELQVSRHFGELQQGWQITSQAPLAMLVGNLDSLLDENGYLVVQGETFACEIDMQKEKQLHGILIEPISRGEDIVYNAEKLAVYLSRDGLQWSQPYIYTLDNVAHLPNLRELALPGVQVARYLRIQIIQGLSLQAVGLASINVY